MRLLSSWLFSLVSLRNRFCATVCSHVFIFRDLRVLHKLGLYQHYTKLCAGGVRVLRKWDLLRYPLGCMIFLPMCANWWFHSLHWQPFTAFVKNELEPKMNTCCCNGSYHSACWIMRVSLSCMVPKRTI